MYQGVEIINLISALACWLMLGALHRKGSDPSCALLFRAFTVLLVAYVATVAEGFLWGPFFDFLEHAAYALAGLLIFLGVRRVVAPREEPGP